MRCAWTGWVAALALLNGCASVEVQTEHDASADFARLGSYFWKQLPATGRPQMDGLIVAAVDAQLAGKGWTKVPENRARTAVAAAVATLEKQRIDTRHDDWGRSWQGWGSGGPVRTASTAVTYRVGTLVIDLYDVKTMNVVWRGSASDILSSSPERVGKSLNAGIRKMFAGFPPGR